MRPQSTHRFLKMVVILATWAASLGGCNQQSANPNAAIPAAQPAQTVASHPPSSEDASAPEQLSPPIVTKSGAVTDSGAKHTAPPVDPALLASAPQQTPGGKALDERARSLLAQMIQTYKQARSYEDKTEFRFELSGPLSVRFERPNKVDARLAHAEIVSDGQEQTIYVPLLKRYTKSPASGKLDEDNLYGQALPAPPLGTISVPLRLLAMEAAWGYVLENVVEVTVDEQPATIDGQAMDVVRLNRTVEDAVIYLDRQTSLVRRIEIDLSDSVILNGQALSGRFVLDIKQASIDTAPKPFRFDPPADAKEVSSFDAATPLEEDAAPAQNPAPAPNR